ncbi:hypothetical protein [uncultured Variovorax sp.]|jgi:hypothetical protein|uniref:hypothetical protein n=1 Tax=uncultured Variovorax sp. TaxID=114708 RepID=UPI00262FF0E7|nr:hypothetical protein [uncultured Variovorax sp.]
MTKTLWITITVVLAAAAGGGAVYVLNQRVEETASPPAVGAAPTAAQPVPQRDKTKEKLEGIGDFRKLKPVQIPEGPAR